MRRRGLSFILFVLFGVSVLGYGLFEARRLVAGPQIVIDIPGDGAATSSPLVTLSGTAQNISFLTINDLPAYTDQEGRFEAALSLPPGYTVLRVAATDRFGRHASAETHITVLNYCPTHG